MNTLTENELDTINGGMPFNLPPQAPSPSLIDDSFWTQRTIWEYLYGS